MKEEKKIYFHVAEGLAGCQQVELELKHYMNGATELIRKYLDGVMPYHMSSEHFENCSLERLISYFKNHSDDTDLVKALNAFKAERNYLAHKALVSIETPVGDMDTGEVEKLHDRVNVIATEASRLCREIHSVAQDIWVHVWFDDESKGS